MSCSYRPAICQVEVKERAGNASRTESAEVATNYRLLMPTTRAMTSFCESDAFFKTVEYTFVFVADDARTNSDRGVDWTTFALENSMAHS